MDGEGTNGNGNHDPNGIGPKVELVRLPANGNGTGTQYSETAHRKVRSTVHSGSPEKNRTVHRAW